MRWPPPLGCWGGGRIQAPPAHMADYTIIKDVELISVGMDWAGVNGSMTFTFEHLADALKAANEDPHIVPPRAKIGHDDPRFADQADPGHDPFYDGEPALGSYRNLRLVNDGATLIGDWIEVPTWLAEAAPSAYPSRSIEGAYTLGEGAMGEPEGSWDVVTPGGKRYSFVLTAVAALGVYRPAVQDLEDLRRFLTSGEGIVVAGSAPEGGTVADASIPSVAIEQAAVAAAAGKAAPRARADIDKVIDSFMADYATEESGRYWWWPRAVWTDPNELIVDDDEGGLYGVAFSSDEDQKVSFAEPEPKLQTFVPAPAAAAVAAQQAHRGLPAATFSSRSDKRLPERKKGSNDGGAPARGEIRTMDVNEKRRRRLAAVLELPEDASDEQIEEKLDEEAAAADDEQQREPEAPAADEPAADDDGEPKAAAADDATVRVDRKVWEKTQADAALGVKAHQRQIEEDRKRDLDAAIAAGKILPSSRGDWDKKLRIAPEATRAELASLAPGLVPTAELGHSQLPIDAAEITADVATAQWFPGLLETEVEANG